MTLDDDDIALVQALADAAGAAIRPYFRAAHGLELKADQSPVTLADRAAERAIRALLARERPDDAIAGEEFGGTAPRDGRCWVIDPIDGTRAFIAGRPIFGTLIALTVDRQPVLGVIDQPVLGERWLGAAGRPTLFNGAPCRTRPIAGLDTALLATTDPALFTAAERPGYDRVAAAALSTVLGGDCYNYACVASGQLDLVIEAGLKLHDFAALVPVIEGAGGIVRDWSGRPLTTASSGQVIALGDAARLGEVIALLAG